MYTFFSLASLFISWPSLHFYSLCTRVGVADCKERERLSVVQALKDVTIPRLLAKDLPSAHLLLQDLFQDDGSTHLDDLTTKLNVHS